MPVTESQLTQLREVNLRINAIPFDWSPSLDEPPDWWSDTPVPGRSWVCRDYVLAKAQALREAGWDSLRLTVILCYTEAGEYHAVLGVRMDDGETIVLDNRFPEVYPMSAPPAAYRWDRRQVAGTTVFEPMT